MKVTYIFQFQPSAKPLLNSSGLRVVSVWQDVKRPMDAYCNINDADSNPISPGKC